MHRHYRRNADRDFRDLERQAAGGDRDSAAQIFIERIRAGEPVTATSAAAIMSGLSVRDLQTLIPRNALDDLRDSLITASHTRLWTSNGRQMGGWFPEHVLQNVCPRGHGVEQEGFGYVEVTPVYYRVREATETTLLPDGDSDREGSDTEWAQCRVCYAAWDAGEIEYQ